MKNRRGKSKFRRRKTRRFKKTNRIKKKFVVKVIRSQQETKMLRTNYISSQVVGNLDGSYARAYPFHGPLLSQGTYVYDASNVQNVSNIWDTTWNTLIDYQPRIVYNRNGRSITGASMGFDFLFRMNFSADNEPNFCLTEVHIMSPRKGVSMADFISYIETTWGPKLTYMPAIDTNYAHVHRSWTFALGNYANYNPTKMIHWYKKDFRSYEWTKNTIAGPNPVFPADYLYPEWDYFMVFRNIQNVHNNVIPYLTVSGRHYISYKDS